MLQFVWNNDSVYRFGILLVTLCGIWSHDHQPFTLSMRYNKQQLLAITQPTIYALGFIVFGTCNV